MQSIYIKAIVAGVIVWIITVLLSVLTRAILSYFLPTVTSLEAMTTLCTLCIVVPVVTLALNLIIYAGTGVLAVHLCLKGLKSWKDAAKVAAIAGLTMGVISALFSIIMAFAMPILQGYGVPFISDNTSGILNMTGMAALTLLCEPMWVIVHVVLATFGGVFYGLYKKLP